MNNEDLISNISYTSKDFNSIYPELLDLVKKLSSKWDPSLSNESDPGVLLLKLNAIIADKNNYNIDKNVLECFPLSVTQEGNARKLYSMLGYYMHWYRTATTNLTLTLKKSSSELQLNQFTRVADSSKQKVFTIIEPISFTDQTKEITVTAIEGSVIQYSTGNVNNNYLVTVNNLDSELRLYFKERFIAENGIFIADADTSERSVDEFSYTNELSELQNWHRVDNLSSYPLGSKIYEFGILPNSNTCYIQFPLDATDLIRSGIYIKYTITQGEQGNIKSNTLSLIYDELPKTDTLNPITNDDIKISQPLGTTDGEDPESIESAYKNYKKTIGTFNNLVTIRDYENFTFKLKEKNTPIISNVKVCDRTNDLNYTDHMQEWTPTKSQKITIFKKSNGNDILNAFDLVFYLYKNPVVIDSRNAYDESFTVADSSQFELIQQDGLTDAKVIQHDLSTIQDEELPSSISDYKKFGLTNEVALKISVFTYDKVTKDITKEIEDNIRKRLYLHYNSREVEFGNPLNYISLVDDLKKSDPRIKNVFIESPDYKNNFILLDSHGGTKKIDFTSDNQSLRNQLNEEMIAKMVCSGNVQLYNFDESFNLDFGQEDGQKISSTSSTPVAKIKKITSKTELTLSDNNSLTLLENEAIQILEPSLVPITEYSSYVNYSLELNPANKNLPANENYTLGANETLTFNYTKNHISMSKEYGEGTTLISNINLSNTTNNSLGSGNYIRILKLNKSTLDKGTKFYFILNNENNTLIINGGESKILEDGEYFLYTSPFTDELIILGSGTEIKNTSENIFEEKIENPNKKIINDQNIHNIDWKILPWSLDTIELNIKTLGEGVEVKSKTAGLTINNTLSDLGLNSLLYKEPSNSNFIEIKPTSIEGISTRIRSRLFINGGPNIAQSLIKEANKRDQSLTFTFIDGNQTPIQSEENSPINILYNTPIYLLGGEEIDVKVLNSLGELEYSLEAYKFKKMSFSNSSDITGRNENGNISIKASDDINGKLTSAEGLQLNFSFGGEETTYLIPIYQNITENKTITFLNSEKFNESSSTNLTTSGNQSFILKVNSGDYLGIKSSDALTAADYITIGKITIIHNSNKYNKDEINSINKNFPFDIEATDVGDRIITKIKEITGSEKSFNWTYRVPSKDKVLYPIEPNSFWNKNHIYNPFILPKIDFTNIGIEINNLV